jgi:hypothetical protein
MKLYDESSANLTKKAACPTITEVLTYGRVSLQLRARKKWQTLHEPAVYE